MTPEFSGSYCGHTARRTIDLIGGKWTMLILWELLHHERRYADLHRRIDGVSQKVLSSELKTLVREGMVERDVVAATPPQVTYRITSEGRSLGEVFTALDRWGRQRAWPADETGDDRPEPDPALPYCPV